VNLPGNMAISLKQKKTNLERRARITGATRDYFKAHGFLEVETPVRMQAPLPEQYIDAVPADSQYLATSPEPHMKQMLAAGYSATFQLARCFRRNESGRLHNPEFTMLEWYRAEADYLDLLDDARGLLTAVCAAVGCSDGIPRNGSTIRIDEAWDRISVDEAFQNRAQWTLEAEPDAFDFDRIMVETIEPGLGIERPAVLYDYPSVFSPMSKKKAGNPARAERLELYIDGIELANGCTEKTDVTEQIAALHHEQNARAKMNKDVYPWPEAFVAALPDMPESAGMALGIDRLVMLLCDADELADVLAFPER